MARVLAWQAACKKLVQRSSKLLRLLRKHPVVGLLLALSLEAWLAVPGEALIAIAASSIVGKTASFLRMAGAGLGGMLINDLALFGLSRIGRGVLVHWIGMHHMHFHLSPPLVMGAKFLPPLRSAAYLIYGLQGVALSRFFWVSLLSSLIWVGLYALVGKGFHRGIQRSMERAERHGRWMSLVEVGLTVAVVAAIWL